MSLRFCVLGSGSRGNSTLLALGDTGRERFLLIDCGLTPRATRLRLAPLGVALEDLSALLLTHLDIDHFHPSWIAVIRRLGLSVHLHQRHRSRALAAGLDGRCLEMFRGGFSPAPGTDVEPILLAHDELGTVGFVFEHARRRLGFATDLGRVPDGLLERFVDLHALALESNYDPAMQRASNRPAFLKRRIMGGAGHLSNQQSLDAVLAVAARSRLSHVVPLHLSQQCNDPALVHRLYAHRAGHLLDRLTISSQHHPTSMLEVTAGARGPAPRPRVGEQIGLF